MGRLETVISPPIRGAARTLDIAHPSPILNAVGNLSVGIQWINRQGLQTWDMSTTTGFGTPPAGSGWTTYRGRIGFRQTGNGTSGGFNVTAGNFCIYFPQTKQGGSFVDDFSCWRVTAILAFDAGGLGIGDTGLEVGPNNNFDILTGPLSNGFRLGPSDQTHIVQQVRQVAGGALTINQAAATVADIADWHMYEMRFIGATGTNDAVFKTYVDGVQVGGFGWGAGTLLPTWNNVNALGYSIGYGNRGATGTWISAAGLQVQASATEAGLL